MDYIELEPYCDLWPHIFLKEKALIMKALACQNISAIEHIGSTAIPNMPAKPIIDILIAVPAVDLASETFPAIFETIDYVFWADNPNKDRLFFVKGMPPFGPQRTHHVHVVESSSDLWSRLLLFRDFLIEHTTEREAYATLKKKLAMEFKDDREAYTSAKDDFVAHVVSLTQED